MARPRKNKMPWHAKPFFGNGKAPNFFVPDTVPGAFTFTDVTAVALGTVQTSNAITVAGITGAAAISVVNGTYNKNGGSYTSAPGTVVNGDVVRVRHTSSASQLTAVNTVLTIGGVSDTFTSTTAAAEAPAEPIATLDFVAGVYTRNGVVVSLTDLLVFDDADWSIADPANIIGSSGFRATINTSDPRFADDLMAEIVTTGASFVAEVGFAVEDDGATFLIDLWEGEWGSEVRAGVGTAQPQFLGPDGATVSTSQLAYGDHTIRITVTPTKTCLSVDGAAAIVNNAAWPAPMFWVSPTLRYHVGGDPEAVSQSFLRTLALYPPVADVDLPALSVL